MKRWLTSWLMVGAGATGLMAQELKLTPRDVRVAGGGTYQAEMGRIGVPENRAAEGSRTIRLVVVRLKSTAKKPGVPLFFLPGGPGNAATDYGASPVWRGFLEHGDVVLFDPRGSGQSEPDLAWRSEQPRPELLFGDRATALEYITRECSAASAALRERGVDLAGYHPISMVDDIDAVRRALGYERIQLLGHSYGTLVALAAARRYPETIERIAAVGVAGPGDLMKLPGELDRSIAELSEVIAAADIGMADFAAEVAAAMRELEAEPFPVKVTDPRSGQTREVRLGAYGLQLLLLADLGDVRDLVVLPRLVHGVRQRDPSLVQWFLRKRLQQFTALPLMMLATRAATGATRARWERIRAEAEDSPFGDTRCLFSPAIDAALGVVDVGDAFRAPVESDVPVLLVSGTLDANTPPFQAEQVRAGLSRAAHLVVRGAGHEDLMTDREVQRRIIAFCAGNEPRDEELERQPLRFAPIEGDPGGIRHPALTGR